MASAIQPGAADAGHIQLAAIHALRGETEEALAWVEQAWRRCDLRGLQIRQDRAGASIVAPSATGCVGTRPDEVRRTPELRRTVMVQLLAGRTRTEVIAIGAIATFTIGFVFLAAVDPANVRPVSGDDVVILSITERFVSSGRMGAPIYDGFHGTGDHSFFALVGHNLIQAPFVWLLGPGMVAARLPSLIAGPALLLLIANLSWRWYGPAAAVLATGLLAFWRTGLVDMDYGFALLTLSRGGRYDITTTLWMWLAILCLDRAIRGGRRTRLWSLGLGVAAGMATITQFYGFAVLLVGLAVWRLFPARPARSRLLATALLGFACVTMPYGVWIARHADDARAQFTSVQDTRLGEADSPIRNVLREPTRYRGAARLYGAGGVIFLVASAAALGWLIRRAWRERDAGGRLLLGAWLAPLLVLALFESTKAPVYAFPMLPAACIAVAAAGSALHDRVRAQRDKRWLMTGATAALGLALIAAEAVVVLAHDRRVAHRMTPYHAIGAELAAALPPGSVPAGPTRWWWALRDHDYVALDALRLLWSAHNRDPAAAVAFGEFLDARGITHLLVSGDLQDPRYPAEVGEEITRRIAACDESAGSWDDRAYGQMMWQRIGGCGPG